MPLRTLTAVVCSNLAVAACAAAPALGSTTTGATTRSVAVAGGVSATPTGAPGAGHAAPGAPKKPLHLSPITARTPNVAYHGPVYEKTATGQVVPYQPASSGAPAQGDTTGGSAVAATAAAVTGTGKPDLLVPGSRARYVNGLAAAPMSAPASVQAVIWAGNQIVGLPYVYGGGHGSFDSSGYDCSGTVSFALHGGALLQSPADSSEFEGWGSHGAGRWIAVFANPEHAYMTVAGLRLDTSSADDPSNQQGPRWRPLRPENAGYAIRHPLGL